MTGASAGRPSPAAADAAPGRSAGGSGPAPSLGLHAFAIFGALWTFALLAVGGLVTSREAGLAVPDWPLSYGYAVNPPGWTGPANVFVEHLHRLLGWGLGIQVIALAVWIQRTDPRPWMRRFGWAVLGLVVLQGVLGGLRVVLLQHSMAAIHGCLGQAFLASMVALALFTSPGWREAGPAVPWAGTARLRRRALLAAVAVYLQVVVGAIVRHSRAGHEFMILLPHVVWGLVATAAGLRAMAAAFGGPAIRPSLAAPALVLGGGLVFQVLLGMGAYFANVAGAREIVRPDYQFVTATAHQAAGAVVFAAAVVLLLRSRRHLAPDAGDAVPAPAAAPSPSLAAAGGAA